MSSDVPRLTPFRDLFRTLRGDVRDVPCECLSELPWASWHSPDCPRKVVGDERKAARRKARNERRSPKADYSVHGGFKRRRKTRGGYPGSGTAEGWKVPKSLGANETQPSERDTEIRLPHHPPHASITPDYSLAPPLADVEAGKHRDDGDRRVRAIYAACEVLRVAGYDDDARVVSRTLLPEAKPAE